MTDNEKKIVRFLLDNPGVGPSTISVGTGLIITAVATGLENLVNAGILSGVPWGREFYVTRGPEIVEQVYRDVIGRLDT